VTRKHEKQAGSDGRALPPRLDPRGGRTSRKAVERKVTERKVAERKVAERPAGSAPSAPPRRGRRAAVVTRVVVGLLSVALLGGSGWGWYLGQVAEASVTRTDAIPTTGNDGGGSALNLLLVGSDSRASLTPEQENEFHTGGSSGLNTDTMILVHLPADGSKASFVSFPRDSYVAIPGHGNDKLNAAFSYGYGDAPADADEATKRASGSRLLVQTISQLTGLQIDHYAEVDLLGFFNLSTVVGGVEVNLCAPVNDTKYSGAVFPAGVQTISGADALKFVRQRHGLPRGDFDRIVRQQVFIAGVVRKILSEDTLFDLGKQRQLVEAASNSLTVDQDLDLFQLAEQMQSVDLGSVDFQTVPYVGDDRDEQDRYILRLEDVDTLHRFFADLSAEPQEAEQPAEEEPAEETAAPADVAVTVYNGSGTAGLAAETATGLEGAGFTVAGTGNADSTDYTRTEIRYAEGDEARARALAEVVPGAKLTKSADATTGTVQLVLGSDYNGVGQAVTEQPAAAEEPATEGKDARTAADTTCIN
jgi:LCP family protein required for cell wall assembly